MIVDFSKCGRAVRFAWNLLKYGISSAAAEFASLFLNEPTVEVRTETAKGDRFPTVALAGRLSLREKCREREFLADLSGRTGSDCTLLAVDLEENDVNRSLVRACGVLNLSWYDDVILDLGRVRIGVSVFDAQKSASASFYRILKRRKRLQRSGAQITVAYVERGERRTYGEMKSHIKKIARCGYSCAAGLDEGVGLRRNMRTIGFSETSVFYSLGSLSDRGAKADGLKPAVIVKMALDADRRRIAQQGYFPAYVSGEKPGVCAGETLALTSEEREKLYRFLQKKMKGLRRWEERLFLGEIFAALHREIPEKYAYMADYTVNHICSRTLELAPGNVFFFRQQFRDNNDKETMNETLRLKLALRAVMRRSLFIFSYRRLWPGVPHVVVGDAMEAHISAMAEYRKRLDTIFIGITGSVGKTSTKDMLYCALSEAFKTEKSSKNANVQIRIGANLQKVSYGTELFIQEIGGGRPGGASRHGRMIEPDAAVITNIGTAHLGNYKSQLDLMENKLGITDGLREGGMLFLNGDDPLLVSAETDCRTCYFAVYNKDADYYAENIRQRGNMTSFDVVCERGRFPVTLHVLGNYNVLNAVCCFAVGSYFGMREEDIARGISGFKTSGTRQNLVSVGGYRLFVDCFNASLDSVETSLSVLTKIGKAQGKKRNAVIGDITGMGQMTEEINRGVAKILDAYADRLDQLVLYGENACAVAAMMEKKPSEFYLLRRPEELNAWLRSRVERGDVTLFKGGSKAKLDERIDDVFGTNFSDGKYVEESRFSLGRRGGVKYRLFSGYATVLRSESEKRSVQIKSRLAGRRVKKIGLDSFRDNRSLEELSVGRSVLHIGSRSFYNCRNLKRVSHRDSVLFIGRSAFENCEKLSAVRLPRKLSSLGVRAFRNCRSLEEVQVPSGCAEVAREAFAGCSSLRKAVLEPGIKRLSQRCFADCLSLEEVRLPDTVGRIENQAFRNCKNLKRICISADAEISRDAFVGCGRVEIVRTEYASWQKRNLKTAAQSSSAEMEMET